MSSILEWDSRAEWLHLRHSLLDACYTYSRHHLHHEKFCSHATMGEDIDV
jgi:hypothetical protein